MSTLATLRSRLLLPLSGSSGIGLAAAIDAVGSLSLRHLLTSLVLAGGFFSIAWKLQAYDIITTFVAVALPAAIASTGLALLLRLKILGSNWLHAWLAFAYLLVVGELLAFHAYSALISRFAAGSLGMPRFFAFGIGFSLVFIGSSLWNTQSRSRAVQLAELRRSAATAELKALQAQVEPHFLFNTLANARYLARHEPEKAVLMLDHMIEYLHNAMPDLRAHSSTLGRELDMAENYMALMAIRFGARMSYRIDRGTLSMDTPLPPLLLMTLVENVIKHGVEPQPGQVQVEIGAHCMDQNLVIVVRDSGPGPQEALLGSGAGLRNMRERLSAEYGDRAGLELRRTSGGFTEAQLHLPLESPAQ